MSDAGGQRQPSVSLRDGIRYAWRHGPGTALAPCLWLAIIGLLAVGLLSIWFIAAANTLVQLAAGDGMRGRMMGLWTMALPGAQVGTGPFAGWVTEVAGPRVGFALPAMALAAIAGAGWQALAAGPVVPDVSAESP